MLSFIQKSRSYDEHGRDRSSKAEVIMEILQKSWKGSGMALCRAQDDQGGGSRVSGLSQLPRGRKP